MLRPVKEEERAANNNCLGGYAGYTSSVDIPSGDAKNFVHIAQKKEEDW